MKKHYFLLFAFFIICQSHANSFLKISNVCVAKTETAFTITPTFNPVAPICAGDPLAPLPTTSLNGIAGSWSPALNNSTTTSYTFTPNIGQDAEFTTLTIIVNPKPSIPTVVVTYQSCSLATITITGVIGETYSFDLGPYLPNLVYSGLSTGTFHTIIAKNAAGCISPARDVTIATFITPNFPSIAPMCAGSPAPVLSGTAPNGITGIWSPPTISNTVSQTYVFTPGASFSGCTTSQSLSTAIFLQPNAGTDGGTTVCDSDITTINLYNLITGEQSGGTWTRITGTGGTFNAAAGTYTPGIGATSSVFMYTIIGTSPCINDSSLAIIDISPQPNAGTSGNITVCDSSAATINLYSLITGEQSGGAWTQIVGTGGTFNAIAGTYTPAPGATTSTFVYSVTGTAPCINSTSIATITINPMASIALSGSQNICVGMTTTFSATASGGTWSSANPAIATVNAITGIVTGVNAGTTSITYTKSGMLPCPDVTAVRNITVNPPGQSLTIICEPGPNSIHFDWANVIGFLSYNFTYSIGGPIITGNTSISNYEVFNVFPGDSVTFTITNVVGVPCVPATAATCNLPLANTDFEDDAFEYFPNPVSEILKLEYNQPISEVMVFNTIGQLVHTRTPNAKTAQIDMSGYSKGIYRIRVVAGNLAKTFKVIRN
jgi:hypothetical protein